MDLARLRQILGPFIEALKDLETHERLGSLCESLGLPNPDVVGSKRDRMRASFAALADDDLPKVAINLLEFHPPTPSDRNQIQDLIWADLPTPSIPKRYRRELARSIAVDDLYLDAQRFEPASGWISCYCFRREFELLSRLMVRLTMQTTRAALMPLAILRWSEQIES